MSPAPTLSHQNIIFTLMGQFYNYQSKDQLGIFFVSPVDVFLDNKNAVQPDIVFVSNQNKSILKEDAIYGAPDLVIEVLSPGSKKFDLDKKKKIYEKFGVKEYWIVDPDSKESMGFQLKRKKFVLFKQEKDKLVSVLLKHAFKF